jgi:anti-sigma B factor antagonist
MCDTSNLPITHTAEGFAAVWMPEFALSDARLEGTRAQLTALADGVYDGELHLDFARIGSLGSTALGVLVSLHRRIDDAGGHLVIFNLAPHLQKLFRLTRLDTVLDVRPVA